MRLALFISVLAIAGCASAPDVYDFPDWGNIGYDGFVNSIDTVAGDDAFNCGFFDIILGVPREARSGIQCAKQAYKAEIPFKFGTVRLPTDSYAYEILVRSSKGDIWLIVYDIIVDGSDPQIWFEKCESVRFSRNGPYYEGHGCTKYDGSRDPVWNDTL